MWVSRLVLQTVDEKEQKKVRAKVILKVDPMVPEKELKMASGLEW